MFCLSLTCKICLTVQKTQEINDTVYWKGGRKAHVPALTCWRFWPDGRFGLSLSALYNRHLLARLEKADRGRGLASIVLLR